MTSQTKSARFLGRCPVCRKVHAVAGDLTYLGARGEIAGHQADLWHGGWQIAVECCFDPKRCTKVVTLHKVRVVAVSKHKCSARCLASVGPSCECECRGRNHGGRYG